MTKHSVIGFVGILCTLFLTKVNCMAESSVRFSGFERDSKVHDDKYEIVPRLYQETELEKFASFFHQDLGFDKVEPLFDDDVEGEYAPGKKYMDIKEFRNGKRYIDQMIYAQKPKEMRLLSNELKKFLDDGKHDSNKELTKKWIDQGVDYWDGDLEIKKIFNMFIRTIESHLQK